MPLTYGAILGAILTTGHVVPGNTTEYTGPFRVDQFDSSEVVVRWRSPRPGTLRNLMVDFSGSQPNDGPLIVTVRWSFTDTAITFTVPPGGTAGIYQDTVNTAVISTGEDVMFSFENQSASSSITIRSINIGLDT